MTSQASLSLSLCLSQKSLTHNIGSASALPIINEMFEVLRQVRLEVNTDHDCKSRPVTFRSMARYLNCAAKRVYTFLSIYYRYLMVISCNTFGVATSPNVADLSTFSKWNESEHVVLPIVIIWHSVRWISGALNEHYLKF